VSLVETRVEVEDLSEGERERLEEERKGDGGEA
jgi:hypothetical protein